MSRRAALIALGVLLATFLSLGVVQADRDAPTVDEAVEVAAGLSIVEHRDVRMNPEHGLLQRAVPALLPSLLADPIVPRGDTWEQGDWFDYTDVLISANDEAGRLPAVVFWFRMVPLVVGAATGVLLYSLGARLLGRPAGLVAAGLWLTTPYILGLAHLSSIDVTFACAVLAVALLLDRFRCEPTGQRLAAVALVLGAALLVRHNAFVLLPVVAAVCLWEWRDEPLRVRLRGLAVVALVPVAVVWVAYRIVDPVPVTGAPRERFDGLIASVAGRGVVETVLLALPMPVEWRAGLAYLMHTSEPRTSYLFGEVYNGSRPWFFPASAFVKIPMTAVLLLLVGGVGWFRVDVVRRRRLGISVLVPVVLLFVFLLAQPLNLGLRLAVPVLALVFVIVGGIAALPWRLAVPIVAIAGVVQVSALWASHPASLAWTPPPFSDGYRYVSDSSIDFAQANRAVRRAHRSEPFVAASLIAPRGYEVLPGVPSIADVDPEGLVGRVAAGATAVAITQAEELAWLRAYCPIEVIDEAVLVYRFVEPPDVTVDPPPMPPGPCAGDVSRTG